MLLSLIQYNSAVERRTFDILLRVHAEESHGTVPLR